MEQLQPPTSEPIVDRWIFDRVLADPTIRALARAYAQPQAGTRGWYDPGGFELVLLPTTKHWLAPAWLGYFGAPDRPEYLCAAQWRWHHRFGAELVASWGTMLQFVVERPPPLGDEAWELADQILGFAGSLGASRWLQAVVVADSNAWFLHDRP